MKMTPIQILDEGIMIPIEYVGDAREFVVEVEEDVVWVRPKLNGVNGTVNKPQPTMQVGDEAYKELLAKVRERYPWAGTLEMSK